MSFIGNMLSGSHGAGFEATNAPITEAVNQGQIDTSYQQSQDALKRQQDFLNAVQAQGGLGNQSQVYNQLQGIAGGTGPNPALAALNQATSANTANQAALMAGQRGASVNPGLIARQAAQQGGANQQAAAGQAATLQAQQQLGAIGAAGQLANQQAAQQANALQTLNQAAQSQQGQLLGAKGQYNQALVSNQGNVNDANARIAQGNQAAQSQLFGGLLGGAGQGAMMMAEGGEVPPKDSGPQSFAGKFLQGFSSAEAPAPTTGASAPPMQQAGTVAGQAIGKAAGSAVRSLFAPSTAGGSPGMAIGKDFSMTAAHGGQIDGEKLAAKGMKVPGKAEVKGDSLKNDKVKALLSPGEIVIPRSVANSRDPVKGAADFVAAVMRKQSLKKSK